MNGMFCAHQLQYLRNMHQYFCKGNKPTKYEKALIKIDQKEVEGDATFDIMRDRVKFKGNPRVLFYLEHLIQLLDDGNHRYLTKGNFGNYVIQNKIVEPNGAYDLEKI